MARTQLMSQDWYRVATLRPHLRSQIEISLHDYLGRDWFILFNRSTGKTVRVPSADYDILRRFDGQTTLDKVWNDLAWSGQRDLPPQDEFIELVSRLYEAGIIALDALPRTATLARMQAEQGREWIIRLLRSPVSQKIPLANPSRLLRGDFMTALAHLVFSRLGILAWLALVVAGVLTAIEHWQPLTENLSDRALSPSNLIILVAVYPVVKLIHELAHALGVRRFGGDVNQVGIMFLVFVPMPYVDASDINRFCSHSVRALVTLAGIFAEFAIAAVALMIWAQSDPGLWRAILFNIVFICTVSTVFFNGNPLLKFDAYYALADISQTPGLGTRGQKLLERWGRRLLGLSVGPDAETAGPLARVWMGGYAVASVLYRVFITFSIALLVAGTIPHVGQVLAVWVIVGGLVWPNAKALFGFLRSPAVSARRGVFALRLGLLLATLIALLAVVPAPSRSTAVAVVTNGERAAVFAGVEGRVTTLHAKAGQTLRLGDPIVTLVPERLSVEAEAMTARIEAAMAKLRGSGSDARAGITEVLRREVRALEQSRDELLARLAMADIRAHAEGTWMPETPPPREGQFVSRGERIGWVDAPRSRRLVAHLPQTASRKIERGVTRADILFQPGDVRRIGADRVFILPSATRQLADDRLADRFGGPVLTEPSEDASGYRAVSAGLPLEARLDLSQTSVGTHLQIKLRHPPEPLLMQIWPRVVDVVTRNFRARQMRRAMADIPAPRMALPLRPPERLRLRREDASWNLGLRLRRLWLAQPLARRAVIARVHAARGRNWPDDLAQPAAKIGHKLRAGRLSPALLGEAFALIDEALYRSFGFRYHDVQLDAGILLAAGHFVEMATGEGKTFTGILPGALHALAGCAVHVVTVNDYLAERDAAEVTPVYQHLGLGVGHVLHDMEREEKRASYLQTVVYCANKELVFDYLRDRAKETEASPLSYRLRLSEGQGPVVRDLDFVLIDEADSVLIDEANIPLILTEPRDDTLSARFLQQATDLARRADKNVWENPDALGYRSIRVERLQALIAQLDDPAPEWNSLAIAEELLVQAKTAEDRFKRDVHYIVDNEKLVLIDQQTGRPTPDRSLPWGLQQIIELREGLDPSALRSTIGKLSFQTYFRKYHKMVGMSGTLREVRRELARTYGVPFASVRTHRPVQRFCDQRLFFATTEEKLDWATDRARALCASGRAVLLGVSSVALSEEVSAALTRAGLVHGVLNARRLAEEAALVADAGQTGRITVVTNMAGRGTDIKLAPDVRAAGGLHVIILDALETDRLDRQLFGRAGRQGDPGSYDIAHSLDEPALERLLGKRAYKALGLVSSLPEGPRISGYFGLLNFRRRWLERVRRKRRLKLISGEEKRDDFLAFTRRG